LGGTSLGQTGQLSSNTAKGVGNAISGAGSAVGAGQVAAGNALGSGVQGAGNAYYLSQLLNQRNPAMNAAMANQQYGGGNVYGFGGGGTVPTGVTNFELG
jgi:hypothetical protein